jgi:hypothetical protein
VLHRDIKPGNILLRADGEPLVADFGLAKLSSGDADASLSVSGHVVGTMENMPPEQAESSKEVDERADVYALGTILYQMLTGRRHFVTSGNLLADAQALKTHEPARLRAFNPRLDHDLEIVTMKALRNDPAERYPSVAALRADLERYQRGEVISAKPVSAIDLVKKLVLRNRAATAIAAASFLLVVATVALALWGLSQQLAREQDARREAETARAEAEQHKALAEEKQREAETKELLANEQRQRAEALLRAKEEADAAAAAAVASSERALAETQAERELRLDAETRAREQEQQLASAREQMAKMEEASQPRQPDPPPPDPSLFHAARKSVAEALTILNFELSPFELQRLERNPDRVVERLSRAITQASEGLVVDPRFAPGWVLKGRLHMAALEFDAAVRSFTRAGDLGGRVEDGNIEDLRATATAATRRSPKPADDALAAAEKLSASGSAMDMTSAGIIRFLVAKPPLLKGDTRSNPLGRTPSAPETALDLMLANSMEKPPQIETSASNRFAVMMSGPATDLSPLRGSPTASLTLPDATAPDWISLENLGLERLDLSGSKVEALPLGGRHYQRLRELDLANTRLASIEAARQMPALEQANLAGTDILDLSPLLSCRRLRSLDISGADRYGLRILLNLPLESLTLSPLLLTDKPGLAALQTHRTLRTLRTPDDPPNQMPNAFWAKLSAGAYETSSAP